MNDSKKFRSGWFKFQLFVEKDFKTSVSKNPCAGPSKIYNYIGEL